ncbi:uncharacterized protein GGS22DRAFT_180063 [Annulohypoxylon maeteangense]|uniref:uncharacterized protein n=1 Tax=Annulohypoxylon maeteangense TaxID=1927788 RepID=UPI00200760E6|nr:uncharacterized protein GGS22DRAFT_180063 [Annulohypoxylon maeteangense]KAI0884854.1 hypothetical protein GGS22DRAFT_180063 [Annulohypoxylon maeteangense]
MDEDNMDIDIEAGAWRRDRLGDEPIYCAAPPPSNPDDIICLGSDEELDDDAKIAKRLRYETQGLRYLQGKTKRIFSASLHGPFEKTSGWKNPWLPKQPSIENTVSTSQPTMKPLPAIKQRLRKYLEQNDTTSGTSNSMRCHLPSPESNRELPLSSNPPETDKHSRIQAWAKDVSPGIVVEPNPFWVPNQINSETDGSGKKRPATKDWLKKQSKRKRLDNPQDIAMTSTPTPLLTAQTSARCSSVPTDIDQTGKPGIPRKKISQSFELATPSSTADQSISESQYRGQHKNIARHQITSSRANSSEISEAAVKNSKIRPMSRTVNDRKRKRVSNAEIENHAKQAYGDISNKKSHQSQNADDMYSESYLDESFHYRTRPTKQVIGVEEPIADAYPEPTQTRTPSSPSSPALALQVPTEQAKISDRAESLPDQIYYQDSSIVENSTECYSIPSRSKRGAIKDQQPLVENPNSTRSGSINVLASIENTNSLHIQVQDDFCIPQPLHEEKVAQNTTVSRNLIAETHSTENQPMDIDGNTLYKPNGISASHHVPKGQTPGVMSTVELDEQMENVMNKETQGNESGIESNLPIVPLSQSEWSAKSTDGAKMVNESKVSILAVKAEVLDNSDLTATTLSEPSEVIPPDSPWVTELAPGADLTIGHVKSEPVDDIPLLSPCPSHLTLLSSQPSGHGTPMIGPSQQSPWGGKLSEPLKIDHGHHLADVEAKPTDTHPSTIVPQVHQNPWAESSASFKPRSKYSLSCSPTAFNEEPPPPHLQLSMAAVGQYSESSKGNPITPPRMPTFHVRTPDLESSIKPFATFNSPSPKRGGQQFAGRPSSIGHPWSIIPDALDSGRSTRRVTFALFPEDDDDIETRQPLNIKRAASPPPQTTVNADDDDVGKNFHNHFSIMKRRASGENIRRRSKPLLPSSSQQMPISPSVGAMAEAFQVADAYIPRTQGTPVGIVKRNVDQKMHGEEQSPWQKESQGVDDVADVMNNLNDFINPWDTDV